MPNKQAILANLIAAIRDPSPLNLNQLDFDREALQFTVRESDRMPRGDIQAICSLARVVRVVLMTIPNGIQDLDLLICFAIAQAEVRPSGDIDAEADAWVLRAIYEECDKYREVRDDVAEKYRTTRKTILREGVIDEETAIRFLTNRLQLEDMKIVAARLRAEDPGVYKPILNQLKIRNHLQSNLAEVMRL